MLERIIFQFKEAYQLNDDTANFMCKISTKRLIKNDLSKRENTEMNELGLRQKEIPNYILSIADFAYFSSNLKPIYITMTNGKNPKLIIEEELDLCDLSMKFISGKLKNEKKDSLNYKKHQEILNKGKKNQDEHPYITEFAKGLYYISHPQQLRIVWNYKNNKK